MDFGKALEILKDGGMVHREGWNGKGMFLFHQVPTTIEMDIIPNMQSLPELVKNEFVRRMAPIYYSDQIALVNADNNISGWSPSTSDALAVDWQKYV